MKPILIRFFIWSSMDKSALSFWLFKYHIYGVSPENKPLSAPLRHFSHALLFCFLACHREINKYQITNKQTIQLYLSKNWKNRRLTQRGIYTEEKNRGLGILTSVGLTGIIFIARCSAKVFLFKGKSYNSETMNGFI